MNEILTVSALSVLIVSFFIGIVVGLTGMGGGALMTPALIFLGVNPTAAVANDLVAASVNKSVGAAVHWREGSPNLRLAMWLIIGSVPCAFAGAFIIKAMGSGEAEQDQFLTIRDRLRAALHRGDVRDADVPQPSDRHRRRSPRRRRTRSSGRSRPCSSAPSAVCSSASRRWARGR